METRIKLLENILKDPNHDEPFLDFSEKRFVGENVHFLRHLQKFETLLLEASTHLWETLRQSTELRLSEKTRALTAQNMSSPSIRTFTPARIEIELFIVQTILPKFDQVDKLGESSPISPKVSVEELSSSFDKLKIIFKTPKSKKKFITLAHKMGYQACVSFWWQVVCFEEEVLKQCKTIFYKYIAPTAKTQINLPAETMVIIEERIRTPTLDTFDDAKKSIIALLAADVLPQYERWMKENGTELCVELPSPQNTNTKKYLESSIKTKSKRFPSVVKRSQEPENVVKRSQEPENSTKKKEKKISQKLVNFSGKYLDWIHQENVASSRDDLLNSSHTEVDTPKKPRKREEFTLLFKEDKHNYHLVTPAVSSRYENTSNSIPPTPTTHPTSEHSTTSTEDSLSETGDSPASPLFRPVTLWSTPSEVFAPVEVSPPLSPSGYLPRADSAGDGMAGAGSGEENKDCGTMTHSVPSRETPSWVHVPGILSETDRAESRKYLLQRAYTDLDRRMAQSSPGVYKDSKGE